MVFTLRYLKLHHPPAQNKGRQPSGLTWPTTLHFAPQAFRSSLQADLASPFCHPILIVSPPTCARKQHATHAVSSRSRTRARTSNLSIYMFHDRMLTFRLRQDHMVGMRQARRRRHDTRSRRRVVHMYATRNSRRQGISAHGHACGCVTRRGMRFPGDVEGEVSLRHDPGPERWTTSKSPAIKTDRKDMTSGEYGRGRRVWSAGMRKNRAATSACC